MGTPHLSDYANMIFVKDAKELRFVRFNKAGEELVGHSRAQLIGKNDYDFFPESEAKFFTSRDREVLSGGKLVDIPEEQIYTAHQTTRILHTKKIPILDEAGRPQYLLGISDDITELKETEKALRDAKREAERANLAKSEFLSRMSHELRTPMNAVVGFAQLLEIDSPRAEQRESLGQILKGGRHLLGLINEVLDISRIEAGHLSVSLEPVPLVDVIQEALDLIHPLAEKWSVRLAGVPPEAVDRFVLADRQRLKQVLLNFLSNAAKFNRPEGTVTVSVEDVSEEQLRLKVTDTGHGIPPEKMARLFPPFELAKEHRPGLILLDLQLPDIPGAEVLRRLQRDPRTRQIPVVVLSADATPGQTKRLQADGAREFLTKPLDVKQLLRVLDEVLLDAALTEGGR